MPTEAMTRHGYGAGPVEPVVARKRPDHGLRYDGDGYFRPQGVLDEPIHLAGVLDVGGTVERSPTSRYVRSMRSSNQERMMEPCFQQWRTSATERLSW
jgi:hypothetical protein